MERDRQSSSQSLRSASHGAAGETDTATRLAAVAVPDHLVYTSDNEPGILRQRKGKGFSYRRQDGSLVRDGRELLRIRQLAIPPAYKQVWICARPNGHLQATGRDARGRKQYRYHADWRRERDTEKFDRFETLAKVLPRIRRRVAADLRQPGCGQTPLLAAVVKLLDTTLGRIGNDEYARENGSYGLTTLCDRHVRLRGNALELSFRGKSGVDQQFHVEDPGVARVVRQCLRLPGDALFRYADDAGDVHTIGSAEVNTYLRGLSAEHLSAKDFRTWHASVLALKLTTRALERGEGQFTLRKMLAEVAQALGNTPAVCRKSYVHPQVLALALLATRRAEDARQSLVAAGQATGMNGLRRAERQLVAFVRGWKAPAP
jgi:DNA topoisomerase-1